MEGLMPMNGLRILITNTALDVRAGTELYVRDLATALLARGHTPIVYSPVLGAVAREIRDATIPVVDDLAAVGTAPDVIHGHHHLETLTALLWFPGVPAVSMCHGWLPWPESPPRFPRVRRHVAVDQVCHDRLVFEHGIPEDRVRVLLNFVDLERFAPRGPLPARPARALVFSNAASHQTYLPAVRAACAAAGLELDVAGLASGRVAEAPETLLGAYDVVFAKGRAALEAMAVGAAVVLGDEIGAGPLVTSGELDKLRALNFGIRTMREPATAEHFAAELARYDAADAARVSERIRREAGRDAVVDELVVLYHEAIAEQRTHADDARHEARAVAESLRVVGGLFRTALSDAYERYVRLVRAEGAHVGEILTRAEAEAGRLAQVAAKTQEEHDRCAAELVGARRECERLVAECTAAQAVSERAAEARAATAADLDVARADLALARTELTETRAELAALNASTTVRLRNGILAVPGVGKLLRVLLRLGKRGAGLLRATAPT
jgi:hypothetical protein